MSADYPKRLSHLFAGAFLACAVLGVWFTGMRSVESEAGLVEIMTALTLCAALILFGLTSGGDMIRRYWFGAVILAFLCAREFDVDKWMFDDGLLSLRHYTGVAPLWQKGVGAAIVGGLLVALMTLGLKGFAPLLRGLRQRKSWAFLIIAALGLLTLGKSLDGFERKFPDLSLLLPSAASQYALFCEEVAELTAALCLLLAVPRMPIRGRETDHFRRSAHHEIS